MMLARLSSFVAILTTLSLLTAPATGAPTPFAVRVRRQETDTSGFKKQNALDAQSFNAKFLTLKAGDSCESDETACIDGAVALCDNGQFVPTGPCTAETQCAALPLVNSKGTAVACAFPDDILDRMEAAGASRSVTGSDDGTSASGNATTTSESSPLVSEVPGVEPEVEDPECAEEPEDDGDDSSVVSPDTSVIETSITQTEVQSATADSSATQPIFTQLTAANPAETTSAVEGGEVFTKLTAAAADPSQVIQRRQDSATDILPLIVTNTVASDTILPSATVTTTSSPVTTTSAPVTTTEVSQGRVVTILTTMTLVMTLAEETALPVTTAEVTQILPTTTTSEELVSATAVSTSTSSQVASVTAEAASATAETTSATAETTSATDTVTSATDTATSATTIIPIVPSSTETSTDAPAFTFSFSDDPLPTDLPTGTFDSAALASLLTATIS